MDSRQGTFAIPDPVFWTATELASFGEDVVHDLARAATGTTCAYQVVLGRCLLAVDRTRLYARYGCSGAVHYAVSLLGLGVKLARTLRRIARGLEALPKLSRAAEQGKVPWGKLREVVPKASPETEDAWLSLISQRTYAQIQALAHCTEAGKMPWEEDEETAAAPVRYRYTVAPELGELFERGAESLSRKVGRHFTVTEAIEYLMVAQLQSRPVNERDLERAREEAARDAAARRRYNSGVHEADLRQAREIVTSSLAEGGPSTSSAALDENAGRGNGLADGPAATWTFGGNRATAQHTAPAESMNGLWATSEPTQGEPIAARPMTELADTKRILLGQTMGGPAPIDAAILKGLSRATPSTNSDGLSGCEDPCGASDWTNPRVRFNPKARGVTPAQRRELLRRDGFQCRTPGCPNHAWLEVHHQQPYALHGPTVRGNLMNLCSRCHRNEQRGFLSISGDPENRLRFVDSSGRELCVQCAMEVAAWLDFWIGWTGGPHNSRQTRIANSA